MSGTPRDKVLQLVLAAVDATNQVLPPRQQLPRREDAVLMGGSSGADSLALVNLIVAIEERVDEEFGLSVNFADDAMSLADNPFSTVASLADYVVRLIDSSRG